MKVCLRPITINDAPVLHTIRSEVSARQFQPLQRYSLSDLRQVLHHRSGIALDAHFAGKTQWMVLANGEPAGWVTLDVTSREHGTGAIGYTIAEAFRGRSIATTAVLQVVELAFDPAGINLERLEAVAAVENRASCRVLEKAGFLVEGVARGLLVIDGQRVDHVRYGLLRSAWIFSDKSH